ncbi:MAG: PAS domain S-box protein [Dehalococcoidales bacterium]
MEKKNGRKQNPSGEKSEHIPQYAPTNASNQSVPSVKASSPARKKNARNSLKNKGQALENRYAIPIVAIGASAGGLKAIQSFFQAMPANPGMAFIVIQHFAPARRSGLPEILANFTPLAVSEAKDGMEVKPNSIYVIPPAQSMGIHDGKLVLSEPVQSPGLRLPINFFFSSLAKENGPNAICIILSGTGQDGTEGLKAIKAQSGTVFVQEPKSAQYEGMPLSAIDTGLVDFVLPPEKMPGKLIELVKHTIKNPDDTYAAPQGKQNELQQIIELIRLRTGHDFSKYKPATIRRRLQHRMGNLQVESITNYLKVLHDNPSEIQALDQDILISVTSFFRDSEAFNALKQHLKIVIDKKSTNENLRIWVNACATGQEVYSVLITITECLEELGSHLQVQAFATDIDIKALAFARAGTYSTDIEADVSPERLARFFVKRSNGYQIREEIRKMVTFATHDLIKDPPFSKMDLVCCRNLLIYLDADAQNRLLTLLHYAINPNGLLFLGSSESVGQLNRLFTPLDKKWNIYQRKDAEYQLGKLYYTETSRPDFKPIIPQETAPVKLSETLEKIFLETNAPTFVVIDEKYRLVYVRGRTGKYLEIVSEKPNLSVLELAREGLRGNLSSAIYQAQSGKKKVTSKGIPVKSDNGTQILDLTVIPLTKPSSVNGYLMIIFEEKESLDLETKARSPEKRSHRRILELEDEIKILRENLQSIGEEHEVASEELKSANEELQSNIEELQSANEELDTTQEELQSTNEELSVVNAELQSKNQNLVTTVNDLQNFLNRSDVAIIFLDRDLKIRLYTPHSNEVFNLKQIDVNRSLRDITSRLTYEGLVADAEQVMNTLQTKEIEVTNTEGHWFKMRIHPYLTTQNVMNGVVISFLDIDSQKKTNLALVKAESENSERMKELTALYNFAEIIEKAGNGIDEICRELSDILAKAWRYPEITCARILIGEREFRTKNFKESDWRQSEPVKVNNVTIGRIDVNYLTKKPDVDEGPFLKEERMLLNTVAERLGRVIQRIRAEEAVKESEVRYRELFENMALGYAYCRMLYKDDNPVDFIYLAVNKAFEKQTGLKNVVGKKISEVIPGIRESDPKVFELYGRVASTGSPETMELFVESLKMWVSISVYSPKREYFVAMFDVITERKLAEESLRKSEEKYRIIVENTRDIIFTLNIKGEFTYVSPSVSTILGLNPDDMIGKHFISIIHPDDVSQIETLVGRNIRDGYQTPVGVEFRAGRAPNQWRWFNGRGDTIKDAQGNFINFLGTANDITERKKAEDELRQSEQNFRSSLDHSILGIRITGDDGDIVYANKALLDIFGYKNMDELRASPPQEHYTPESRAEFARRHEKYLIDEPLPDQLEVDIIRKDGAIRHLRLWGQNVLWNGKWLRQVINQDITDLVEAEKAVKESEEKYRMLVDNTLDVIFTTKENEEFLYVSPAVKNALGYDPEQLIGKPFISFVYPEDVPLLQEEIKRSYRTDYLISKEIEYRMRHASGEPVWVVSRGTRLVDSNGNFRYFIGIIRNVTEHKLMDQERQKLEDKSQVANRLAAVGEMAAGIAHEINNPLAGVLGFSQMLLERDDIPEGIKSDLKLIADGSQRVADIVRRLLTFARQAKPIKTLVNLNDIIDNTLKLREYVLKTNNIQVVKRFDADLPSTFADPGQLQQVFLNLIVNAEQAMKKANGKGTLTITTEAKDNNIYASFQDDGPGISKENLRHLFEPFFTTKDVGEGTGLGLSLSRSIILEHNGIMRVESEFGQGATFIIELPIIEEPPAEDAANKITQGQLSLIKSGRIMVIDDELPVRTLLEKVLTPMGYSIETVDDADTVLNRLKAGEKYDVILLDIRMPGMSGTELYTHILEKAPELKGRIIIITGDVMGLDIKEFLTKHNLPSLSKPFDIKLLKEIIDKIIKGV